MHHRRAAQLRARSGSGQGKQVLSLLSPLSDVVAQVVQVDAGAAARLTDVVLSALPVDASAVASAIPQVTEQVSAKPVDIVPLVIPAVAAALGKALDQSTPVGAANLTGALSNVVEQGTLVINQITSTMRSTLDPQLQAVLDQVAVIVYAAAGRLDETLCAISQDIQGVPLEAVIPCSAADLGPVSVNIVTLNPAQSGPDPAPVDTASWNVIPAASSQVYGPSQSPPPAAASAASTASTEKPAPTSRADDSTTGQQPGRESAVSNGQASTPPNTPAQPSAAANPQGRETPGPSTSCSDATPSTDAKTTVASSPVEEHAPGTTCPSCDDCPPKECPVPESHKGKASGSPDAASGPCPGRGFHCPECLDGWFCPAQETPAQVVPCGLGWPCHHCSSGWFCVPDETAAPAPATTAPTATASAPGTPSSTGGDNGTSPAATGSPGAKDGWNYLGCFQDAINRTLVGSRPLDYLRGDMSNSTCMDHCGSKGYLFAGTENGKECWCGLVIRDDAVRLPENLCSTPCQGAGSLLCGGSWAVSVFMCSREPEQAGAESPPAPVPAQPISREQPPAVAQQALPAEAPAQDHGPMARLLLGLY